MNPYQEVKAAVGQRIKGTEADLFGDLQKTIDAITEKAQQRAFSAITLKERFFLQVMYQAMSVVGSFKGLPEAAQLLRHYLGRSGATIDIDSEVYRTSSAVTREIERQKPKIAAALRRGQAEVREQSGKLVAEQTNLRLKYTDNRFILYSVSRKTVVAVYQTTWKVEERYDFEDFKGGPYQWRFFSKWSEFPFRGHRVKVYDGLSRALVDLGMAREFDYHASWTEQWKS